MMTQLRSVKTRTLCVVFGLLAATTAQGQVIAFQGGETGDNWAYTSTGAGSIAISEATMAPNKVAGATSLVVGGNTGGGSCFSGGSGNGPTTARTFVFDTIDISQSSDFTRTLVFNWGNRFPMCNGTGWDAGENLVFTAYHDGVQQTPVTIVVGNNNAAYSIQTNQFTWTIPTCKKSFYFEVTVTTNRADELLFLDNVTLSTPQMNTTTAQPSPISGPVSFCSSNGTGTYSVTNVPGANYTWSGLPAGAQFTSPNGTSSSNTINVDWGTTAPGTYTLTVTPSNTCIPPVNGTPQTLNVTIEGTPTPLTISGPTSFCPGQPITISSNYATGNVWSNSETTQDILVFITGTYTVTVQTACATLTASSVITETPGTQATITPNGPTTFCTGGSVTLTSGSPTGNTWSTNQTTPSITVSTAGTYTLTVAGTCGSATASQQVTVLQPPVAAINALGPLALCPGNTVTLVGSGGTSYSWSNGQTNDTITVSAPGTYSVTVTNQCGSDVSSSLTVTALPAPTAQINGASAFCPGDSTLLTASGGTTYVWSTGETGSTNYVTAAGSYTVTSTNQCGSVTSAPFTVTLSPLPTAQIIGNNSFCAGDSTLLTASNGTSYTWSTGQTGSLIYATTGGNYTVTSTNQCGSVTSAPFTVTVLPLPTAQITGNASFCAGDSTLLTVSGGTAYLWSTGEIASSIYVSVAGTYSVTSVNQCGQASSAPFAVSELPLPVALISGNTTFCPGQSVVLTASGGTGYQWSTGAQTTAITVSNSGTYTVAVTNACGTDNASITVTETVFNAGIIANPVSGNEPLTVDFTDNSSAGVTTYDWNFDDGSSASISDPTHVFNQGSYSVVLTVTNADGCTDNESILITVLSEPSSVGIPNVFTPDGDGSNDLFFVTVDRIETYHLQLFNRWGNLIKESTDWKDAWDGTINGDPATEGTYFYDLQATGIDGKDYHETGFFNLIR